MFESIPSNNSKKERDDKLEKSNEELEQLGVTEESSEEEIDAAIRKLQGKQEMRTEGVREGRVVDSLTEESVKGLIKYVVQNEGRNSAELTEILQILIDIKGEVSVATLVAELESNDKEFSSKDTQHLQEALQDILEK